MKIQNVWVSLNLVQSANVRAIFVWDHSVKTSTCLREAWCPHVLMVKRSQYLRIKNPLHKHFAGMPMEGGRGQKS